VVVVEGKSTLQAEVPHDAEEIAEVLRLPQGRRLSFAIDAHIRSEAVKEEDVPTEPAEAEEELEVQPG
jgi:hypothetical protein